MGRPSSRFAGRCGSLPATPSAFPSALSASAFTTWVLKAADANGGSEPRSSAPVKAGGVHDVPQCGLSVGKMRTVELAANDFVPSLAVFGGISGAFRCGFAGLPELAFAQVPPACNPSTEADLHLRGGGRHSSAPSRAPSRKETTSSSTSCSSPIGLILALPPRREL